MLITWDDLHFTEVNLFVSVVFTEDDRTERRSDVENGGDVELEEKSTNFE